MTDPLLAPKAILKLLGFAPKVAAKLAQWNGKLGAEDRKRLVAYCRRIDERRVFSTDYGSEVVECCVSSLSQVKEFTDATLAEVEHPAAQAVLGAILDSVRAFLDRWGAYHTPRFGWDRPRPPGLRDADEMPEFFADLGELRSKMGLYVGMLTVMEPKAKAPKLLDRDPQE
jgi:hypothetical protein